MSCLCSSPELEAFKFTLTGSYRFIPVRSNLATRQAQVFSAPKPDAVPTRADFVDRRVQQETRSPPADALAGEPFQPVNTSPSFLCRCSSAKSGFRSLCGRKQRSRICYRALINSRFRNLYPLRLLPGEPSISPVSSRALHRCCERNVVGPGQYSKRFLYSNRALWRHFSPRNRPRDARQVGFWGPIEHQPCRCHERFNIGALALSGLHDHCPTPAKQPPGLRDQGTIGV